MFKSHPVFRDPESTTVTLWRYMDFAKLVHILTTKSLFFPADTILHKIDPFEGSLPVKEHEFYLSKLQMSEDQIRRGQDNFRATSCVTCWHYNETESVAMWKLYSQIGSGIAVQSTIPDFKESFREGSIDVCTGEVRYIDYRNDYFFKGVDDPHPFMNGFTPFIHKRSIFSFEHEYRGIATCLPKSEHYGKGMFLPVILELLIKRIVVAPSTPDWIYELVKSELRANSLNISVDHSVFDDNPNA